MGRFFRRSTFSKKEIKDFISWANMENVDHAVQYHFNDYCSRIKQPNLSPTEKENIFSKEIKRSIKKGDVLNIVFDQSFKNDIDIKGIIDNNKININSILISCRSDVILLNNLNINQLIVAPISCKKIEIISCNIRSTIFHENTGKIESKIFIHNTKIFNVEIYKNSVGNIEVIGCIILDIRCPTSYQGNPFLGSVSLSRNYFPKSTKGFPLENAQAYRNLRAHLLALQNTVAADKFHALEQAVERETDTLFNRIVSRSYEALSDFGGSILRPVVWLGLLTVASVLLIWIFDGAVRGLDLSVYQGWRAGLLDNDAWGRVARAVTLGTQPLYNPLGIFGAKTLLVARSGWIAFWLSFQAFFSAVLVALTILAVRRRFKMK